MKVKFLLICAAVLGMTACGASGDKAGNAAADTAAEQQVQGASKEATGKATSFDNFTRDSAGIICMDADDVMAPDNTYEKVTVVDFSATWCAPCKRFAPVFEEVASEIDGADFVSVDIDKSPETATAFGVNSVPTVIILDTKGRELRRFVGIADIMPAETFRNIVKSSL